MADTSLGISLVIKAVDQGTAVLSHISAALDKIGLSSTSAGAKADQAGKQMTTAFSGVSDHLERKSQSMKKVEDTLSSVRAASAGIGAAITAPKALAVKTAANFENEMNKVKAVADFSPDTKVAQDQFDALTAKAREFGYKGYLPPHSVIQHLGDVLNVCGAWLWFGLGHKISHLPRGLSNSSSANICYRSSQRPRGRIMTQTEQCCWDRCSTLKSTVQLIKMKKDAGMDVGSDKAYATQLLEELKMYADADLMPAEMKEEYQGKIGAKLEALLQ